MRPVSEKWGTSAGWMQPCCLASGGEIIQWVILSACIDITIQTGNKQNFPKLHILHSFVHHCVLMQKTRLHLMCELEARALSARGEIDRIGTGLYEAQKGMGMSFDVLSFSLFFQTTFLLSLVGAECPGLRLWCGCPPNDPCRIFNGAFKTLLFFIFLLVGHFV